MSFVFFLGRVAEGFGCTVHEGLGFSLENDWDDPSAFDGVAFFVGGHESSVMPTGVFVQLLAVACEHYVDSTADDAATVLQLLDRIRSRYTQP